MRQDHGAQDRRGLVDLGHVRRRGGNGFDSTEVDSPSVAVDAGRVDKFLLYYEASNGANDSTIGLVSSDEEDFEVLTIGRTQVVGWAPREASTPEEQQTPP